MKEESMVIIIEILSVDFGFAYRTLTIQTVNVQYAHSS